MLKKMMACVSALLVTASLSCAVLTASAEDKEYDTILKNPGLEDLNEDGTTTFWDSWPSKTNPNEGTNQVEVTNDVVHSGKNALKVELLEANNHAIYQYHLASEKRFPFNKEYTFSCWVKMDNVVASDDQGISIGVNRKGADGNSYDLREHIELGTYDWTKVSITVPKAMVGLVQYDVIVDIGRGTGTLYVDDFELVEGSGTTTPTDPDTPDTPDTPDDPDTPDTPDDPDTSEDPDQPGETTDPSESGSGTTKPTGGSDKDDASKPATTTKAQQTDTDDTQDGSAGWVLPVVIVAAVVIAGAAVVVAVLIIREKKKKAAGPTDPTDPQA